MTAPGLPFDARALAAAEPGARRDAVRRHASPVTSALDCGCMPDVRPGDAFTPTAT